MPADKTALKAKVLDSAIEVRRKMQYEALLQWDRGSVSPRQCIEKILELEKIIYIDPKLLRDNKPEGY